MSKYQKHAGAVRRFARVMKLAGWIQDIPNKMTPPPFRLMQIGSAFWQSRALYVATRLDIASTLGDRKYTAEQLAEKTVSHADATNRLMRFLSSMGIFEETGPGCYRNNKLSDFLNTANPKNVRAMILMHNSEAMSRPWYEQLEQGIREGQPPFRLTHGDTLFPYLDQHPDMDALFSDAMNSVEALSGDSFVTDFDWGRFQRIIDLGGSRGTRSLAILRQHPHMQALVIDREPVIAEARAYWETHHSDGIQQLSFEAGDILSRIPAARDDRDAYLLAAILHGFDDDSCTSILKNLASAIGDSGARCALMDLVLPEQNADLAATSFDMQMFMGTQGRERTLSEWQDLIEESGLKIEETVGLRSFGNILVLHR